MQSFSSLARSYTTTARPRAAFSFLLPRASMLCVLSQLMACNPKSSPNVTPSAGPQTAAAPASVVSGAATVAELLDAGVLADARPPVQFVNLLTHTASEIAVSSNVDNPYDVPDHLVDGRNETAWNSKTGDLVGAWIDIKLPADSQVGALGIVVGFDHKNKDGDLFTMNHRIKKIRILSNGTLVKEHAFSTDMREMQFVPIQKMTGSIRIEVTEVTPGTKANWKELCVSELMLLGVPGSAGAVAPKAPQVVIGKFGGVEKIAPPLAGLAPPTYSAADGPPKANSKAAHDLCAKHERIYGPKVRAHFADARRTKEYAGDEPHAPLCDTEILFRGVFTDVPATVRHIFVARRNFEREMTQELWFEQADGVAYRVVTMRRDQYVRLNNVAPPDVGLYAINQVTSGTDIQFVVRTVERSWDLVPYGSGNLQRIGRGVDLSYSCPFNLPSAAAQDLQCVSTTLHAGTLILNEQPPAGWPQHTAHWSSR
jgi:hypothetical protein